MSTVAEIIDGIKHRLPERANLYPAINTAIRVVSRRLFLCRSSYAAGNLSVSVSADSSSASLPSDFWGLIERPYVSTRTWSLLPIPDQETKMNYTGNSEPKYYEIAGTTINLIPGSASAITLNGQYWKRPTKVTRPSDVMPFNELFDDAIQESIVSQKIGKTQESIIVLKDVLMGAVDDIAQHLDKIAPKRVMDSLGLDSLTNEEW